MVWCWQLPRLPAGTPRRILGAAILAWPVIAAPSNAWLAPLWLDWEETVAQKTSTWAVGAGAGEALGGAEQRGLSGGEEVLHGEQGPLSTGCRGGHTALAPPIIAGSGQGLCPQIPQWLGKKINTEVPPGTAGSGRMAIAPLGSCSGQVDPLRRMAGLGVRTLKEPPSQTGWRESSRSSAV